MCLCSYLRRTEVGQHQLLFSLLTLLFNFLSQGHWTWRPVTGRALPGQQVSGILLSLFHQGCDYRCVLLTVAFLREGSGSEFRSSCFPVTIGLCRDQLRIFQEDELIRLSYCSVLEGPGFSAPEAGYRIFQMILYTLVTHAFWKLSLSPLS